MKKAAVVILAFLLLATSCLSACSGYASRYNAMGMVTSNTAHEASLKFNSLQGTVVFRLKADHSLNWVRCEGSMESGSLSVYYDCGRGKELLVEVNEGAEVNSSASLLPEGVIYIIVETDGVCKKGDFRFSTGITDIQY